MSDNASDLLLKIINWARGEAPIRALMLIGSRARPTPTDDLADIDVCVFATSCTAYLSNDAWLRSFGDLWIAISEQYTRADIIVPTRLAIFSNGIKVDVSFLDVSVLIEMARDDELNDGYVVLLDKDGVAEGLLPPTFHTSRRRPPTQEQFLALVDEFWFEAYHVAKYLWRGELWLVKSRDWSTKELLCTLIEWHAQSQHNWEYDTAFQGKHLHIWAEPAIVQTLHQTFAHFDIEDSWAALLATVALFRRLAVETAEVLGYPYPTQLDQDMDAFVAGLRNKA